MKSLARFAMPAESDQRTIVTGDHDPGIKDPHTLVVDVAAVSSAAEGPWTDGLSHWEGQVLRGERRGLGVKRMVDVAGALFGLVALSPVALLLAALIKLDSRGPVFYRQVRMGRKRDITILKFRSMYQDADQRLHDLLARDPRIQDEYDRFHKLAKDPRVTRIGRYLRKYSLDELPQLWNVLRGEMSLVGPRPYLHRERHKMRGRERVILSIRPGLTGLWQTQGRNALCFQKRMDLDLDYVQNWSLGLDVRLLWRTLPVVIRGEGAR